MKKALHLFGKSRLAAWLLCITALPSIWAASATNENGRYTLQLSGEGWYMWRDRQAQWKNDSLYLPEEAADLLKLPVNPPTGGWAQLDEARAVQVQVPGTVEEYTTVSDSPKPEDGTGVSWWFRTIQLPTSVQGKRVIVHFESVRMRAEVYLDKQLVGYDIIGESPFDVDITHAVKVGKQQQLAIRVTHPGGNFHWQDFEEMSWGRHQLIPGRSFGGIIGGIRLDAVNPLYVSDIYMQNQPNPRQVKAILTLRNEHAGKYNHSTLSVTLCEKKNETAVLAKQTIPLKKLKRGDNQVELSFDCPEAKLWNLETPNLYLCKVELTSNQKIVDTAKQTFGFRWLQPVGIGKDAKLVLNGRRVMLRTAISWGYWPVNGLYATSEMAKKQVRVAKQLGLNMLNFHRSIGSPVVLDVADELGLLYYEEPGGFHAAGHDTFIRAQANIKLARMIYRDRSHPSLIIYNLINEWGGAKSRDTTLTAKRMNDMKLAHQMDPSRVITFTSGWAGRENAEEDAKAHMLPYDTALYRKGWFDNHRAGGPSTWEEGYYKGATNNLMFTDNRSEIYMRGEEGAISTPPRIALIHDEISREGRTGWDGLLWKKQYSAFLNYFIDKDLKSSFGSIDAWTRSMGDVALDHQGRRIQGMRMQDVGDIYAVNGWEAMPYDNHSGIVDIYRNCKGNADTFTYYTQPLYIAVSPCSQFVRLPGSMEVDFYIVNEQNLKGNYRLSVLACSPEGEEEEILSKMVKIEGGDCFGQLLHAHQKIEIGKGEGMHCIKARLLDAEGRVCAMGRDQVLAIAWSAVAIKGNGALYTTSDNDPVATFYRQTTGNVLPAFRTDMPKLDWLVVTRSSLDAPQLIPDEAFRTADDSPAFQVYWFKDSDIGEFVGTTTDTKIDRVFANGEQPSNLLPANQSFSAIWKGKLKVPQTGTYMIGISSNQGVRLSVNNQRIVDEWRNKKELTIARPFQLQAGEEVEIRVEYSQNSASGKVQLVWSLPGTAAVLPQQLLDRVKNDGTTLLLLKSVESWMDVVESYTGCNYKGYYSVGRNWVGGIHFAKSHPLLKGLPINTAMGWPYQALVREGDKRLGLYLQNEEMIVGSYRTTPFCIGSAMGIIPCGKGKIIYTTLDVVDNLLNSAPAAEVARKLFCNMIISSSMEE